jgi:hypothetical protein
MTFSRSAARMFLRGGADFRAEPVFAARLLSGRFSTFTAFALRIVARIHFYFVSINIFKPLPHIKRNRPNGNFS